MAESGIALASKACVRKDFSVQIRALAFKRGKYVNKFMPRMIFFISALVTVLFAASCSEDDINKSNENNELTAAAVSKIYRACKYPNEEFCEEACCKSAEKCNDETAFKECDLEAGEWKNGLLKTSWGKFINSP